MVYNIRKTFFAAGTVADMIVGPNELRRFLRMQVFGPPDVTTDISVWVDYSGAVAVPFECFQMISGAVWEWGRPAEREFTRALNLADCPTGPISVVTISGTAQGVIEELV